MGADTPGIRYCYPPVRVNASNLCAVRTIGINLSTRLRIVWRRGKANINRVGLCDRAVLARFVIVLACPKVVRLYRTYLRNRTVV